MILKEVNKVKVIVTGKGGQLASEFEALKGFDSNWTFLSEKDLDITRRDSVLSYFNLATCDLIINCAAYTAVDKAEDEAELAFKVNAEGTKNLVEACELMGAKLIHYSTDYVFDGRSKEPYTELDTPNPNSVYGVSKLKGEEYILANQKVKSIILRTSWVYSSHGSNFVKTMITLGGERDELGVVADQIGSPTYAKDLAKDTLSILNNENYKWSQGDVFHYSNNGSCSWFEFARTIFELTNITVQLSQLNTVDYPTKASRPKYSLLDKSKFENTFKIQIRDWRTSLIDMLKQELTL
jgi:dTDP-4-dehydrorhamnose reductase